MYPQIQMQRRYWTPFTLLLSILLAVPTFAVSMRVTAGFNGVAKSSLWMPVAVEINNNSENDIEGLLLISQEQSRTLPSTCSSKVVLPAHSKKLYHDYIRLGQGAGAINVALVQNGKPIELKKCNIDLIGDENKLIVSVGNKASCPSFLNGEKVPVPLGSDDLHGYSSSTSSEASIHAASISPDKLPDRPAAYDSIDVLMVSSLSSMSASPKALEAVQMWIASGGVLVVSAGANYKDIDNSFYNELLPVKITGTTSVKAFGSSEPIAAINSTAKPGIGRIIQAQAGVPLLVERDYGAGKVVFLAVDRTSPAFRNWSGQTEFWKEIIKGADTKPLVAESLYTSDSNRPRGYPPTNINEFGSLAPVVAQSGDIKAPSFNLITLYLFAYFICLVPLNYFFLKRKNRLEMAWITTPAIVLAFTICAYGIGYTMKGGKLHLNEVRFIEASSDCRYGRMLMCASLFSPARSSYDVSIKDPIALSVVEKGEREDAPRSFIDEQVNIEDVYVAMWSSRLFESKSGCDLRGSIKANLVLVGNRIKGTIANNTGKDLHGCSVVYGDNDIPIALIRNGQTENIDVEYISSPRYRGFRGNPSMMEKARNLALNKANHANVPILVGWLRSDTSSFSIDKKELPAEVDTCYMFKLNYRAGNSAFRLGPETARAYIMKSNKYHPYIDNNNLVRTIDGNFYRSGYVVTLHHLAVPVGGKITSLQVQNIRRASSQHITAIGTSIKNLTTGKWDTVTNTTFANKNAYVNNRNEVLVRSECNSGGSEIFEIAVTAFGTGY